MRLKRSDVSLKGKKWFHRVGTFRIVKPMRGKGDLRMVSCQPRNFHGYDEWHTLTDSHVKDVFVWLGRYLAMKGKLPKNLALEEIAVGAQRTAKAIREVNAIDIYRNEISQLDTKEPK